jgi:hypothetical protein
VSKITRTCVIIEVPTACSPSQYVGCPVFVTALLTRKSHLNSIVSTGKVSFAHLEMEEQYRTFCQNRSALPMLTFVFSENKDCVFFVSVLFALFVTASLTTKPLQFHNFHRNKFGEDGKAKEFVPG